VQSHAAETALPLVDSWQSSGAEMADAKRTERFRTYGRFNRPSICGQNIGAEFPLDDFNERFRIPPNSQRSGRRHEPRSWSFCSEEHDERNPVFKFPATPHQRAQWIEDNGPGATFYDQEDRYQKPLPEELDDLLGRRMTSGELDHAMKEFKGIVGERMTSDELQDVMNELEGIGGW